ncbi:hypothetical protein ACFXKC_28515 [Streptomyces sp. NPDC059340]|uniref:hypothetical protein n=1 Tax=Streptomyces sp. NPDC059340 TaxID=3346806 RepID=UPI00367CE767
MTTPVDELRAAAFQLRNPLHLPGLKLGIDPDLGMPLADWLDETATEVAAAEGTEYALHPNGGVFTSWEAALAVARAINGSEQR